MSSAEAVRALSAAGAGIPSARNTSSGATLSAPSSSVWKKSSRPGSKCSLSRKPMSTSSSSTAPVSSGCCHMMTLCAICETSELRRRDDE
jgi:hypothetical protein